MNTAAFSTPAHASFAVRARAAAERTYLPVSTCVARVHGTAVLEPTTQIARSVVMSGVPAGTKAIAAMGGARWDAQGGKAFEDPV